MKASTSHRGWSYGANSQLPPPFGWITVQGADADCMQVTAVVVLSPMRLALKVVDLSSRTARFELWNKPTAPLRAWRWCRCHTWTRKEQNSLTDIATYTLVVVSAWQAGIYQVALVLHIQHPLCPAGLAILPPSMRCHGVRTHM